MKASDITDEVFLAAMDMARELRPGSWVTRWDLGAVLDGDLENVRLIGEADRRGGRGQEYAAIPWHEAVIPEAVILAKARKLIRRGLIYGCACGCRGDFTKEGWE